MAGDSAMDDPSSVDHFLDWVQTWTSKKPVGETIQEDAELSVAEAQPAKPTFEEKPAAPIVSSQKQDDGVESIVPIISVAHKAAKPSTTPTSERTPEPEPEPEPVERKNGNGLMDSDYAPSKTRRVAYKNNQERTPSAPQTTIPVRFEVGGRVQHDVMEYFDTKRREYYDTPKTVLQSKDPNASLKSPKKTKLNPLATEYSAVLPAANLRDEPASTDSSFKADQQEEVIETAEDSDTMDLTPMLNVLGARTVKIAETAASQEIEQETNGEVTRPLVKKEPVGERETIGEVACTVLVKDPVEQEIVAEVTRSLVVKNLPEDSDYTLVQSVIQGATIMSMKLSQDTKYAEVKVTDVDACRRIIESGKNGVEVSHNGRKHTVSIEMSSEDAVGEDDGLLEIFLDCGATRAVQAEGIDMDLTMRTLNELASGPGPAVSREVEDIIDSLNGGARKVVFRFTSIQDAVAFRASLRRKSDWKDKNVKFVRDPCA